MAGRSQKSTFRWMLRQEDLEDRLSTDMAAACSKIQRTSVLTVHGDADADVPVSEAHKIAQAIKVGHGSCMLVGPPITARVM